MKVTRLMLVSLDSAIRHRALVGSELALWWQLLRRCPFLTHSTDSEARLTLAHARYGEAVSLLVLAHVAGRATARQ